MAGEHVLAVPVRQRAIVGIDATARAFAQAVIVVEGGVADPLRGGGATVAAELAGNAIESKRDPRSARLRATTVRAWSTRPRDPSSAAPRVDCAA